MAPRLHRSICIATLAATPFIGGMGVAHAEDVSTGQDRLQVDTDTNLTDQENFLVDARVTTVDDDGDATGLRSRTTSSDLADFERVRTDNRTVSNDEGNDATSLRAIIGFDDLNGLDEIHSDVDLVTIDESQGDSRSGMDHGEFVGQQDEAKSEQQYREDAEFVFGR